MSLAAFLRPDPRLAWQALREWTPRQIGAAAIGAVLVALLVGIPTVLIPNPIFGREIPPTWWSYPAWIATSVLSGMLLATYVRPGRPAADEAGEMVATEAERSSRFGVAGTVLAWFAVGCPVCNKIALIALGYGGAMTWFAPVQPVLAVGALLVTGLAFPARLRGQVACPLPAKVSTPMV